MSTKSEGLASIQPKLPSIKARIKDLIDHYPGLSREDIAELEDIRLATVCGAVNKLIEEKQVRVHGTYVNPNTGRNVEKLEPVFKLPEEV